ncbi:hypothetical protein [Saccharothrix hoggarensis]|uniref:Secreted protein with PEP-CTERM sorting signal n=1 Tax=Saccharothrix hoggarensis TaxID=913853 RepID=A0ABW3QXZ9_9PSEU
MDETYVEILPIVAIMVGLLALGHWWRRRSDRKSEQAHAEALAEFAGGLGGRLVDPAEAHAWSAGLLEPMRRKTDGLVNQLNQVSPTSFGLTVDFPRGRWAVRVGEASVEVTADNGTRTAYEYRIEVATAPVTPMKISRRIHDGKNLFGRPLPPDHVVAQGGERVREVPVTVAAEGGGWYRVSFPPGPFDTNFAVFTSDPAAVAPLFDPRVAEHLLAEFNDMYFTLHFEAGLLFCTLINRIIPDQALARVDALIGLLERMGVAPAHPPVWA